MHKLNKLMEPQENKKEGVVFKKHDSAYVSGRPNSGGNQLKFKFYATDTFEVVSHNKTKRSVNVVSYKEDGTAYDMGKITIPETTPLPPIGAFVEIRYLYCNEGGKLFQTTYLCERDDQDRSDCHMREIKFKAVDEEDEE
jgi:bifunctional non-homologous end joining protein LigD